MTISIPKIVQKPWGSEEIFIETPYYAGKIITINNGHRLSLQYHKDKWETIRVLEGVLRLEYGFEKPLNSILLYRNQSFDIPPLTVHRMIAPTFPEGNIVSGCTLLEISTPHLDDVVRLEDDYGRI